MDSKTASRFADITALARTVFDDIEFSTDATPERAILRLQGGYGFYRVFITELISRDARKYRYYVLLGSRVEAGFDNSPDPRALRLKYGRITRQNLGEPVPHLHEDDKNRLSLTEEMTFEAFIHWLGNNFNPER